MDFSVFVTQFGSHFDRMRVAAGRIRSRIGDFLGMENERQAVSDLHDQILERLGNVAGEMEALADSIDNPVVDAPEAEAESEQPVVVGDEYVVEESE